MSKKEIIIFTIALIVIFIFAVSFVIFSFISPKQSPLPSPSITGSSQPVNNLPSLRPLYSPSASPTPSPSPITATTKDELVYQLPFQSDLFNIEYLSVSDLFAVTIKQNPYQENVDKANKWFEDRGYNPEELNVYYHAFPGVQR